MLLAVLLVVAAAAVATLLRERNDPPDVVPRHVVLVVFDTLRADRMSTYGHSVATSPFQERTAGELLRFAAVTAPAPWTVPSHASMFTGLWPSEHRAQWGSYELGEGPATLAEILSENGFCTVGLSANSFVSSATGLDRGFDAFEVTEPASSPQILREAAEVLDRADECGRLFLFVNLMDTHIPYNFGPYARELGVTDPPIRDSADKWAVSSGERKLGVDEIEQHRAAYDAAVRATDDLAAVVLGILRERELLDETLVVFTSDHGDGLGDHPEMGHVLTVWEEQLAVPLVVRLPAARRGGEVFAPRVSLVGLAPSILDWLEVPRPAALAGRPTLERTAEAPVIADYRSYFAEDRRSFNQEMAIRYPDLAARVTHHHVLYCGSHKLIVSPGGRLELYDLQADPTEQRDLSAGRPPELGACVARYREVVRTGLFSPFDRTTETGAPDAEDLERLRALGYLQ